MTASAFIASLVRLGSGATAGAGGEADPAWSQAEAAVRQSLAAATRPWPRCPPGGQPGPEAARAQSRRGRG
jgi:hypothetical protein